METKNEHGGKEERIVWVVERPPFADLLSKVLEDLMRPPVKVRLFSRPEMALEALQNNEGPPDALMTAFYFDGEYRNGLWLVQEASKLYPELTTIVASGYPVEHLKGVAADMQVQPNLLLGKGADFLVEQLLSALKELLIHRVGTGPTQRPIQRVRVASEAFTKHRQGPGPEKRCWRKVRGKALVYFVGPVDSLNALKSCIGQETQPAPFKRGYDWKHFVNPEAAWATLEEVRKKPDAVVADYYLSGGEMNGLKVVR
jgi:hypothetical protein